MAKFKVSIEKENQLYDRMSRLGISEADILEKFVRGSGAGGQKINKTSSCVYLKHIPTGIEVKCQAERSQSLNRFLARRELCDKIETRIHGERSQKRQAFEKIRRQKRKRSKRAKEKMLFDKSMTSKKKASRRDRGDD